MITAMLAKQFSCVKNVLQTNERGEKMDSLPNCKKQAAQLLIDYNCLCHFILHHKLHFSKFCSWLEFVNHVSQRGSSDQTAMKHYYKHGRLILWSNGQMG